jgi:RNA polymerase sigma factor (TIGR02999 family)
VYAELRRIAHARIRAESPGRHTLQTTALVNEAYVRLVEGAEVPWRDRTHFYAVCARLMRRILVDRARARAALKRQAGDAVPGDHPAEVSLDADALLALDEALERLATADARKADVVVLRYFGGLTVEETAAALNVSSETVMRDWKVSRLWLRQELEAR